MTNRLVEVVVPAARARDVDGVLEEEPPLAVWRDALCDDVSVINVLVASEKSEKLLDLLEKRVGHAGGLRVVVLPVEVSLPRPPPSPRPDPAAPPRAGVFARISRQELLADVEGSSRLSWTFLLMTVLSAIVAAIGLSRDSVAIIIGAMVIAPLLGPNVALALGTTLGDLALVRRAAKAALGGAAVTLLLAIAIGAVFPVEAARPEMASRTRVGIGDVALALASGVAGALAFTTGAPASLIGVMVAVALVPPLVTCGMLAGCGHWGQAAGAGLLALTNVICVNLAGVVTFLAQGIRPRTWWEADKARRATRVALALWALVLAALVAAVLAQRR